MRPLIALCCLAALCAGVHTARAADAPGALPNIVIIFIDDMGYGDVGPFGATDVRTPNVDRLAAAGTKFTSFYATPVCSMSRACLMTGCYNARVSMPGVLFPQDHIGLNPNETTVAEVLKTRGYSTIAIGKWHLGHLPPFLPIHQGFDEYFGIPYSNDMGTGNSKRNHPPLPIMRGEKVLELEPDQNQLTRRYTQEAVRFIEEHHADGKPFFVYLPHSMVHNPLAASEKFRGKSKRGLYGDAVEEIDWSVGQILDTLDRLKVTDNTLVIFTSDNGPAGAAGPNSGSAGPFRGRKATNYEGGVREPCIMRWPGHIPAGATCDRIAGNIDVLPTLAKITGAKLPGVTLDGRDISSLMFDPKAPPVRDVHLYYTAQQTCQGIRMGDWKLLLTPGGQAKKAPDANKKKKEAAPAGPELYNLADDIAESRNLAADRPEIVAKLRKELEARDGELQAHKRPIGSVDVK